METSSNSNVTAINQSNERNAGTTAERLNGSTVRGLIQRDERIEPGHASLIRAAVDFGFLSSVYSDVIERLKTVEKNQSGAAKQ